MNSLDDITEAIRSNVRLMVDHPEYVTVECLPLEGSASLRITVDSADLGKIIGKQGRTARSLRVIASAMGMASKLRVTLDIQE
jgi:predicted RNA-binding protein YlqC (UPF0109 family)